MNELNYEEMTNAELGQLCEERGIDVDSKNVSKPTKAEYITALTKNDQKFNDDADDFLSVEEDEDAVQEEDQTEEVADTKQKPLTKTQLRRKQYNEAHMLKRVIINSNSENQTKTNLAFITWGNTLLGHNTDRVVLGKPWHIRNGALQNLKSATITESVQNEAENRVDTVTKPAYIIQELEPLSEKQIQDIAKRQQIRDSSIESLI